LLLETKKRRGFGTVQLVDVSGRPSRGLLGHPIAAFEFVAGAICGTQAAED
jgi:hypothetical protein